MNKYIRTFVLAGVGAAAALSAQAQPNYAPTYQEPYPGQESYYHQDHGFYLQADPGIAVTRDTELKEFFGPVAPGSKVKFDTGVRADFAIGYQVTDWFALEAETGIIGNRIREVTGASRVDDAYLSNVPLLFNIKFQGPKNAMVTPFIGAGVGTAISVLDADHLDIGGVHMHGSQSDAVFAYQAFAGLRFRINHRMGLSVAYRYFATEDPVWQADFASGTVTDTARFGGAQTHSISAIFDFSF